MFFSSSAPQHGPPVVLYHFCENRESTNLLLQFDVINTSMGALDAALDSPDTVFLELVTEKSTSIGPRGIYHNV